MSIRGDLHIGETLRGTLRKKSHSYTVMGRVLLKRRDRRSRSLTRWEQWRLIDDNGKELWLEINRDANKAILHEPVSIQPTIDPLALEVGQARQVKVNGRPYTVEVEDIYRADIDYETGTIPHPTGAVSTTTCVELRVKGARKPLSSIVIDEHRCREREAYRTTALLPERQSKIFGRPVYRPWWVPGVARRLGRWLSSVSPGLRGSWKSPLFWVILFLILMAILEWNDDDGLIPSGGGSFFRNRSVYGGGGGGVGK
ncbi:hypothetical protein E4J66_08625 [Actinomyces viscosus]|uniref:hypothetical protein n=1 Tax=Actinomyces viscosus TaxID=1656 RepID=UPI000F83960E|nr:hypothetical protein [Actinomyces viscosus]TFH52271.1 hypothetical protein E4J66_08625 [Actinomyces viscosus]